LELLVDRGRCQCLAVARQLIRMKKTRVVCHDPEVIARPALVGLICMAFLVPQSLGLHWHGASGQDHAHVAESGAHQAHKHPSVNPALELAPSHLQAHVAGGEFDVQPETSSPGKAPSVKLFGALLALAFAVLTLLPVKIIFWPPLRPPRARLNARFLPPSHAPPLVA
jgi:hypothetical protein